MTVSRRDSGGNRPRTAQLNCLECPVVLDPAAYLVEESCRVSPIGTSARPERLTFPVRRTPWCPLNVIAARGEDFRPIHNDERNAGQRLDLLMLVGRFHKPDSAGNGGRNSACPVDLQWRHERGFLATYKGARSFLDCM